MRERKRVEMNSFVFGIGRLDNGWPGADLMGFSLYFQVYRVALSLSLSLSHSLGHEAVDGLCFAKLLCAAIRLWVNRVDIRL